MTDTHTTSCKHPDKTPLTAYKYGCRCDACVENLRSYMREYWAKNKGRYAEKAKELGKAKRQAVRNIGPLHIVHKPSVNPAGYVYWHMPEHPLATKNGRVAAHRWVLHWKYGGLRPARCEQCATPFADWSEIDAHHLDHDRENNAAENIGAWCRRCNRRETPSTHMIEGRPLCECGRFLVIKRWRKDGTPSFASCAQCRAAQSSVTFSDRTHQTDLPLKA